MAKTQQPPINQVSKGAIKCNGMLLNAATEVWHFSIAGAPTDGAAGDGASWAGKGSLLIDSTNGVLYINTGTKASPTWTKVGTQS
jgi:hypothetical protein